MKAIQQYSDQFTKNILEYTSIKVKVDLTLPKLWRHVGKAEAWSYLFLTLALDDGELATLLFAKLPPVSNE